MREKKGVVGGIMAKNKLSIIQEANLNRLVRMGFTRAEAEEITKENVKRLSKSEKKSKPRKRMDVFKDFIEAMIDE